MKDFLTAETVSKMINRTPQSVRRLCSNGLLTGAEKFGNAWIIPREAVENYKPGLRGFAEVWRRRREKDNEIINTLKNLSAVKNEE